MLFAFALTVFVSKMGEIGSEKGLSRETLGSKSLFFCIIAFFGCFCCFDFLVPSLTPGHAQFQLRTPMGGGGGCQPKFSSLLEDALHPILGVEIKMLDDAAGNRDSVVVVHTVVPNGPADVAGVRPGDVLKEWDGLLLDSKAKFQRLVDASHPGVFYHFDIYLLSFFLGWGKFCQSESF